MAYEDDKKVTIKIPEDLQPLFEWALEHEPSFEGKATKTLKYFLRKGIRATYMEDEDNEYVSVWEKEEKEAKAFWEKFSDEGFKDSDDE